MDFRERITSVLHHAPPDKVPFAPNANHLHRGEFEREMRNRGAGLVVKQISGIWAEMPDVRIEITTEQDTKTTYYHTPVGTVSTRSRQHLKREIAGGGSLIVEGMIKGIDDYDPVIFMIENTKFHADNSVYENCARDLGNDGIIRHNGFEPPYGQTRSFFGGIYGLDSWVYAQNDNPDYFEKLLKALERRTEKEFPLILDSPVELISCGSINGNISPEWLEQRTLAFYKKYVPLLREKGKICLIHAHASNVKSYAQFTQQTGVDVVEALTPPPVGNLSLPEARAVWGQEKIIWINFPETVFWNGPEYTKQYTIDLLKSDPPGDSLIIGFTEMGQSGIHDDNTERVFTAGIRAIAEAIEEYGSYPIS